MRVHVPNNKRRELWEAFLLFVILVLVMLQIPEAEEYPQTEEICYTYAYQQPIDPVYCPALEVEERNWWGTPQDPIVWEE